MIKNITIGSDPEYFVRSNETNKCVPGSSYTYGTKESPEDVGGGYAIQLDNALLEANIPICRTKDDFVFAMNYIAGFLGYLVETDNNTIMFADSGDYDAKDLDVPEFKVFGCDPYKNVWTNQITKAPDISEETFRTAGCHIHIGYELDTTKVLKEEMDIYLTKAFDLFVVLPSYLLHFDPRRSKVYGGVGQYREKSYGVECRSLGGHFASPERAGWVWEGVQNTIEFCKKEENLRILNILSKPEDLTTSGIKDYLHTFAEMSTSKAIW